jgi:hypothetical protein
MEIRPNSKNTKNIQEELGNLALRQSADKIKIDTSPKLCRLPVTIPSSVLAYFFEQFPKMNYECKAVLIIKNDLGQ